MELTPWQARSFGKWKKSSQKRESLGKATRGGQRHCSIGLDAITVTEYFFSMIALEINAEWDEEARVWVAQNDQLGLATEAESMDVLLYKLQELIPELADLNGYSGPRPVPFTMVTMTSGSHQSRISTFLQTKSCRS
jgi:hypothetical protein